MSTRYAIVIAAFLALTSTHILAADAGAGVAPVPEGNAEAMNRMGIRYATGSGVPQDFVAALAWYQRAAERGSTTAMNNIATMHYHGLGVPQSYEEAVKWLRLAVKQGDAAAQNKLGAMYDDGLGVTKSAHDAFELFSLAAAQGYAPGMANLGRAYAKGSGVKRDEIRAYALISAAMETGVRQSERDVALYELGALSQRLNAKQLERAQADARSLIEARSKELSAAQVSARNDFRL
jgi:Sel1 repeat-containing protein